MTKTRIIFSAALVAGACFAQEPARLDPTVTPQAMADTLRQQLAEIRALRVKALVVGEDDTGIALLSTEDGRTLGGGQQEAAVVRPGSTVQMDYNGTPVRMLIQSVSSEGVRIETPSLDEQVLVAGSFKPLPPPPRSAKNTRYLRYIEAKDLSLDTTLKLIADQSDANLSVSDKAAQERVSVFLRNVTVAVAVEEICRSKNLWFRTDETSGIIRISTMEEYEKGLSSFREEVSETFTLLYPNVFEVASAIYGLYPDRVMLSMGDDNMDDQDTRDITRRLQRFSVLASGSSSGLLNNNIGGGSINSVGSYGGGYSSYGGYGGYSSRNNILMLGPNGTYDFRPRETYSQLTADDAKLLELSRLSGQTALEQTAQNLRENNATIFVTASKRNNMLIVRTSDPKIMSEIRALVHRLDIPTPMVLLEVRILQLAINDDFTSSFEYAFHKDYSIGGEDVAFRAGFPGLDPLIAAPNTDAMTFQFVSDVLSARIQLLAKEGRVKTMATPSLLIANNEVSRLFIGEERPMVRNITSETVVNQETVVTVPQTEMQYQPVGTMLLITPSINADRTVSLRLLQENSKILKGDATIPIVTANGEVQNVAIDVISSRSISGTFIAKDEMVVAAGGLIEEEDSYHESKVPLLGDIPFLGWLFKSKTKTKLRSEMIILIKPHVIVTPSESEAISQRFLQGAAEHPAIDGRPSLDVLRPIPKEKGLLLPEID